MRKRPSEGLLANMWELISVLGFDFLELECYLLERFGLEVKEFKFLGEVKHAFTHRIWYMYVYHIRVDGDIQTSNKIRWMKEEEMNAVPISTAHKKILSKAFK